MPWAGIWKTRRVNYATGISQAINSLYYHLPYVSDNMRSVAVVFFFVRKFSLYLFQSGKTH